MIVKVIENFKKYLDEINKNAALSNSGIMPITLFSNEFKNEILENKTESIILSPNKNFDTDFLIIHKEINIIKISYIDNNKMVKQFEIENPNTINDIKI